MEKKVELGRINDDEIQHASQVLFLWGLGIMTVLIALAITIKIII